MFILDFTQRTRYASGRSMMVRQQGMDKRRSKCIIDVTFNMEREPIIGLIVDLVESGYKVDPVTFFTLLYTVSCIDAGTVK